MNTILKIKIVYLLIGAKQEYVDTKVNCVDFRDIKLFEVDLPERH